MLSWNSQFFIENSVVSGIFAIIWRYLPFFLRNLSFLQIFWGNLWLFSRHFDDNLRFIRDFIKFASFILRFFDKIFCSTIFLRNLPLFPDLFEKLVIVSSYLDEIWGFLRYFDEIYSYFCDFLRKFVVVS